MEDIICKKCEAEKSENDFYSNIIKYKEKTYNYTRQPCKVCFGQNLKIRSWQNDKMDKRI